MHAVFSRLPREARVLAADLHQAGEPGARRSHARLRPPETTSIVLAPHLVDPLAGADRIERELNILLSGTFNVGMLGVAATPVAARFLEWWQDRVYAHCRHATAAGMHYEQRWLDLVPGLFGDVHVLRDPAYNVGHWNLPDRAITVVDDVVLVNGDRCRLFRFSGYDFERPAAVTQVFVPIDAGERRTGGSRVRALCAALERHGFRETKEWPYAFGAFDNGAAMPDIARSLLADLGDAAGGFGDPLRTGPGSYYEWLNESVDGEPNRPGSRDPAVARRVSRSARSAARVPGPALDRIARRFSRGPPNPGCGSMTCPNTFLSRRRGRQSDDERCRHRHDRREELRAFRPGARPVAARAPSDGAVLRQSLPIGPTRCSLPASEPFEMVLLDELAIPDLQRLAFGYYTTTGGDRRQAVPPAASARSRFHHGDLHRRGYPCPGFAPTPVRSLRRARHHAHSASALALSGADRCARELNILQSGVYNGGFVGVSEHEPARRFLRWWADRLQTHCRHHVPEGMHYDQRWLDLVPTLFEDVHIVGDEGCNVAHWNLPERGPTLAPHDNGHATAGAVSFISAASSLNVRGCVTRYSNRLTMESIGPAAALFARYVEPPPR